jgi:hypothetical protein
MYEDYEQTLINIFSQVVSLFRDGTLVHAGRGEATVQLVNIGLYYRGDNKYGGHGTTLYGNTSTGQVITLERFTIYREIDGVMGIVCEVPDKKR